MTYKFDHNGKQLTATATSNGEEITVQVRDAAGRGGFSLTVTADDFADMAKNPATQGTTMEKLEKQAAGDYRRYVDEVIPAIIKANQDEAATKKG